MISRMKIEHFLPFLLVTFLVSLLIYYFVQWKLGRRHLYKLAAKIPLLEGITMYPVIGHALELTGGPENVLVAMKEWNKYAPCPPRCAWLGHRYYVIINRPEDMEIVLSSPKCLSKDNFYKMTIPAIGEGLFNLPAETWKKHRKIIMPTFNQRILDSFVEIFVIQAEICVGELRKSNGQLVDLAPFMTKYGLDAVSETAMGIKIHAQTTESELEAAINRGMDIIMIRMGFLPYHSNFLFNMTKLGKEAEKIHKMYSNFISSIIRQKRQEFDQKKIVEENNNVKEEDGIKRKVFLDLLMEYTANGENWTEDEFIAEVSTFMVAGSDTGATVSGFTLLLLAMHADIQEKCYQEVMDVIGLNKTLTYTDLPKYVYLEKVIKESMRIFPVGPNIVREVEEDLEVGRYVIPKGAGVIMSIMAMHHSEKYFKDPFKFDPERFSPEEIAKRHKYVYLPFSGGPRNCVGPKYGMMSVKTLLSIIIRNFRLETDYKNIGEIRLKQSILLKPVNGIPVRLIPRK